MNAVILAALVAAIAVSQGTPLGYRADPRVRTVDYVADGVISVPVSPGVVTRVVLERGEKIIAAATGVPSKCDDDEHQWCVVADNDANEVWIKPKAGARHNNLELKTDRRDYSFDFEVGGQTTYRVDLRYAAAPVTGKGPDAPSDAQVVAARLAAARPQVKNTNYSLESSRSGADITPQAVFDDGIFTYFKFPGNSELPTIFVIASDGKEARANYNMSGDYMVVQRLGRKFVLLLSVQVIKARMSGPKPKPDVENGTATPGLARSFNTEAGAGTDGAPALPGSAAAALAAKSSSCPDGTDGSELKGQDGVVVRNGSGQAVRVCANGQVVGVTAAPEAAARPIPVEAIGSRLSASRSSDWVAAVLGRASNGQMMLNDGKYGSAPLVQDLTSPQAAMAAATQTVGVAQSRTEGLLTSAPANSLEPQLTPSKTPMVEAGKLNNLNLLLPKGHTIDCGMSMRIASNLAGEASCILTSNVYSANGKVVLLPRGSEAVGEYRSGAAMGQKRLFVLWTRIITPDGVVINLDSPGADELGSSGLTGKVDNHWFERIGSAFLLSTVQDAIQYEVEQAQAKSAGSALVFSNTAQAGDSMAQKVLESTINIPPTILKNQGDRAIIYVARDLDFSHVYTLRPIR